MKDKLQNIKENPYFQSVSNKTKFIQKELIEQEKFPGDEVMKGFLEKIPTKKRTINGDGSYILGRIRF